LQTGIIILDFGLDGFVYSKQFRLSILSCNDHLAFNCWPKTARWRL